MSEPVRKNEIVERVEAAHVPAPASEATAILSMIERAARDPNVDVDKFERLMAMRERIESQHAKRAFNEAIAAAKAEIEPVMRNRKGHTGRYADFAAYARVVDKPLTDHGLSYRFRTNQTDKIMVTCILSHRDGHSEETTLAGPPETSGSKNAVQAIGSTLTYLQRYSLIQSLGLASATDDDGEAASSGGEAISEVQIEKLQLLIVEVGADIPRFCQHFKIDSIPDLPAKRFQEAVRLLETKRTRGAR